MVEVYIKADKTGLHIPREMIDDFPPDTVFSIRRRGTHLILTSTGLAVKTKGIVEYQEIEFDEAFDEIVSRR